MIRGMNPHYGWYYSRTIVYWVPCVPWVVVNLVRGLSRIQHDTEIERIRKNYSRDKRVISKPAFYFRFSNSFTDGAGVRPRSEFETRNTDEWMRTARKSRSMHVVDEVWMGRKTPLDGAKVALPRCFKIFYAKTYMICTQGYCLILVVSLIPFPYSVALKENVSFSLEQWNWLL